MKLGWIIISREDWEKIKQGLEEILEVAEAGLISYDEWIEDHNPRDEVDESYWIRGELSDSLGRIEDIARKLLEMFR
ncbi:MAG: hypothetical protein QXW80_02815 [Candidatus Micrarchaeia archaeon]